MYETMTYEKILESMSGRMAEMDFREGSVVYDSVAAVACQLEEMYFLLDNYLNLVFADTSAGEFLDRFAVSVNVTRKEAVSALRQGTFDKEIPLGTRFFTAGEPSLIFVAVESAGEQDGGHVCLLQCETAGKVGNEYYGSLIPVEHISGLGKAELGEPVISGTDRETDEAFRERLLNKIQRPSASGNVSDYYNWTMACSGVGAAKIFPLMDGPGTVGIVIVDEDRTAADEALIGSVAEYIETLRPIGAAVSVESAVEKAVNISAKVKLTTGTLLGTVQNSFRAAVAEYLQDNIFEIGYVSLARIGNLLMGIPGVEDYAELKLNGEEENVTVGAKEAAMAGTVRLEVISDGNS